MRRRDRERVERLARDLVGDFDSRLARDLTIVWVRDFPDGAWGIAISDFWMVALCESRWSVSTDASNHDTLAHELAHLLAWKLHGEKIRDHGHEWRQLRDAMIAALDEVT